MVNDPEPVLADEQYRGMYEGFYAHGPPWPVTPSQLAGFTDTGLTRVDYRDSAGSATVGSLTAGSATMRSFTAVYGRPPG